MTANSINADVTVKTYLVPILAVTVLPVAADLRLAHDLELLALPRVLLQLHLGLVLLIREEVLCMLGLLLLILLYR